MLTTTTADNCNTLHQLVIRINVPCGIEHMSEALPDPVMVAVFVLLLMLLCSCRERCGGQGYLSVNRFGELIGFAHAGMTAEGDNRWALPLKLQHLLQHYCTGKHVGMCRGGVEME